MSAKPKPSMEPFIGTWPTPETPVWELIQKLKKLTTEEKLFKEYDQLLTDFTTRLCTHLRESIKSDIACLCKYREADLCTEPKIRECLPRLVHTALLYDRICCR